MLNPVARVPVYDSGAGPAQKRGGTSDLLCVEELDRTTRYYSDGDLLIDNNGTERSLRSFARWVA